MNQHVTLGKDMQYRVLFCLGLYLIISGSAAPVFLLPAPIPHPDLIYCFAAAWLVRRPDFVLTAAVVAASLATELLLLHTPGLWSAAMLLLTNYFRRNSERLRNFPFWLEWATSALLFAAGQAACHLILAAVFLPAAPAGVIVLHAAADRPGLSGGGAGHELGVPGHQTARLRSAHVPRPCRVWRRPLMFTMRPEIKLGRSALSRRALLLGIGQASVLTVIGGRLRYLQVSESESLSGLADRNRINIRLLTPERGLIYDRSGEQLAANENSTKSCW